ncbi:hypothetical protein LZ30DRAFT_693077 [Colletotrichum cereale]|nr:hypothetical protein LZ30DRAFT_693077 [Colletotrichum cereale]
MNNYHGCGHMTPVLGSLALSNMGVDVGELLEVTQLDCDCLVCRIHPLACGRKDQFPQLGLPALGARKNSHFGILGERTQCLRVQDFSNESLYTASLELHIPVRQSLQRQIPSNPDNLMLWISALGCLKAETEQILRFSELSERPKDMEQLKKDLDQTKTKGTADLPRETEFITPSSFAEMGGKRETANAFFPFSIHQSIQAGTPKPSYEAVLLGCRLKVCQMSEEMGGRLFTKEFGDKDGKTGRPRLQQKKVQLWKGLIEKDPECKLWSQELRNEVTTLLEAPVTATTLYPSNNALHARATKFVSGLARMNESDLGAALCLVEGVIPMGWKASHFSRDNVRLFSHSVESVFRASSGHHPSANRVS